MYEFYKYIRFIMLMFLDRENNFIKDIIYACNF